MPKFRLRSWEDQTLYDSRDYEVEAKTIEEAAKQLNELQEQAQAADSAVPTPASVRRLGQVCKDARRLVRVLDPREIVDGNRGIDEIDEKGEWRRGIIPTEVEVSPDLKKACELLVRAYVKGQGAGGSIDWSDLDEAYQAALAALGQTGGADAGRS